MAQFTRMITVPPGRGAQVRARGATLVHLTYRIGPDGQLLRAGGSGARGGLMGVDVRGFSGSGRSLGRQIVAECAARGFRGVLCDFEGGVLPGLSNALTVLAETLRAQGLSLLLPEAYAACTDYGMVMISSAMSGGCLETRLGEAVERLGRQRVVLAVERMAERFYLPSPAGYGTALSQPQLQELIARFSPSIFYSGELCARYFSYLDRESGAHFVLFDDGGTIAQKIRLAQRMELPGVVMAWPEISPWAEELFPTGQKA